jgi:chemotaxis protein methyltransferase WspC
MTHDQKEIERLLARRIGLDPVALGPHLVVRAARRRMTELGLDDLGVYASRVVESTAELQELIEEVVVPESWFFRDDRPFRWLADYVRERWVGDLARPPMRILSLACAGGEEPYSIAITMRDVGLPARRFQIDAVDVSARRLAVARRGVYSANAFRGSALGDRTQYFRAHDEGYEVDPAIRSTVRFLQASVLDPKLLEGSLSYDVIFCRNLLIYLDAPARACVLAVLDRLLVADGVLFIGHADRLDLVGEPSRFAAAGEPGCFAYRKVSPSGEWRVGSGARKAEVGGLNSERRNAEGRRRNPSDPTHPSSFILHPSDEHPALTQPNPERLKAAGSRRNPSDPTHPSSFLEQAADLANQGRHAEAIAKCERHLRQKGPSPSAYYLMGMICQAAGERRRAEDCFHKTVYLDPKHDEALLALALLAERRGDRGAAAGFRRRASRTATTTKPEGDE